MNAIVSLPILTVFFIGMAASFPDAFAAKIGFATAIVLGIAGQFIADLHFLHMFFIGFIVSTSVIALVTYTPVRKCFGKPPPVKYVDPEGGAKVDISDWAYMPRMIVLITMLLV